MSQASGVTPAWMLGKTFKVLVCGGRMYGEELDEKFEPTQRAIEERRYLFEVLDCTIGARQGSTLIHGCAKGADSLAALWAASKGWQLEPYPADWKQYGMQAGPRRNAEMLSDGKPDLVIAFPGGTGTADMVRRARKARYPVLQVVT